MEVRCKFCGKMIALKLDGKLEFYCPKCKKYQVLDTNVLTNTTDCGIKSLSTTSSS